MRCCHDVCLLTINSNVLCTALCGGCLAFVHSLCRVVQKTARCLMHCNFATMSNSHVVFTNMLTN